MTSLDEDFVVIGLNDLDKEGKKTIIKSTYERKRNEFTNSKIYKYMEKISEKLANELGFNNSNFQYALDTMELREFHKYIIQNSPSKSTY